MKVAILILTALLLAGCADQMSFDEAKIAELLGFWHGFWHGFVCFFSFFASLFSDDIAVYVINNNGGWYDFGFLLGAGALTSSAYSTSK